jgi:hypothetical protein
LHKTNVTGVLQNKKTTSELALSGLAVTLDLSGAMYLADDGVLLVADLHLEKGSAFAKRGMLLPPYDTRETLAAWARRSARRSGACRPGATGSGLPGTTTAPCRTASAARSSRRCRWRR